MEIFFWIYLQKYLFLEDHFLYKKTKVYYSKVMLKYSILQ